MCYNLSTDWRLWSRASHNHETLHLAQSSTERRVRCYFSLKSVVLRSETTKKTCYFFYVISWPSLPTKDPLMTVRNTIFFRTVELAYNQGDVAHFHEEVFFLHSFVYWLLRSVFSNVHAKEVWLPGLAGLRFERSGFEVWPGYCVLVHCCWCDYCLCCLGVELQEFIPSLESLIDGEELKNTGLSENATFHFLLKSGYERMERAAVLSL